jgi:hypothetical protein
MGVPFHVVMETSISISPACFRFNDKGDLLCVEDDEMGGIRKRESIPFVQGKYYER